MRHLWPFQRSAIEPTRFPELSNAAPTAVHTEAEVHETPPRPADAAPGGLGTCWMLHLMPFQRSASTPDAVLPVAVHAEEEVHETAAKPYPGLWEAVVGWMRHLWPFQRSASVPTGLPSKVVKAAPTAVQLEREVHDTPFRPLAAVPAGLGVGSIAHLVPFQRSASVPAVVCPTAWQDEGEVHDKPRSCAPRDPTGFRVCSSRHRWPFQRCAIVSGVPEPFENRENPNALHASEEGQATPRRKSPCTAYGLEVRWMRHLRPFQRSASVSKWPELLP
jgi:hypothetical protein